MSKEIKQQQEYDASWEEFHRRLDEMTTSALRTLSGELSDLDHQEESGYQDCWDDEQGGQDDW